MAKFKLVEKEKDAYVDRLEALLKRRFDSKETARRAAAESGLQNDVVVVAVKKSKK